MGGYPSPKSPADIKAQLDTWRNALVDVPDGYLVRSFQRATADFAWDRAFPVKLISAAYKALVREDRERIEQERKRSAWQNPDTFRCWICEDSGYVGIELHCPALDKVRRTVRPCSCEMAPMTQRLPQIVDSRRWTKTPLGYWQSSDALPCNCPFCTRNRINGHSNQHSQTVSNHSRYEERGAYNDYSHGEEYSSERVIDGDWRDDY